MNKKTAIAICMTSIALHSASAWAGFALTQVNTAEGKETQVKILTDGTSSKIEYVTALANNPFLTPGSYMISKGDEMFLVNPSEQTFARFDLAMMQGMAQEMAQAAGGGAAGAGMFQIKDVKVEKVLDEPGEKIAGFATRHYQFKSSWSMAMTSMPMSMDSTAVEDYWTTDELEISLGAGASVMAASGLPASARESDAAKVLKEAKGFPLRQVTVQSMKTNMGGALGALGAGMMNKMAGQATKTTMEIASVQEVDVPADTFEIPAGYREVQLFRTGPAMPDLNGIGGKTGPPNLNGAGGQPVPLPDLNTPR
jgi:hypothetical protein